MTTLIVIVVNVTKSKMISFLIIFMDRGTSTTGVGALLYPELPSVVDIKAKAISKTRKNSLSAGAIKDELIYQLSAKCIINWKTLEITQKYFKRAEFVLYRINL